MANEYLFGDIVPQSYEESIKYLNMAVKQGCPNAMCGLAKMYDFGEGVAQSFEKATELYALAANQAANQGHAGAQYNLGVLYEDGTGVTQSIDMARKWWLKAALQEDEDAIKALKIIDQQEGETITHPALLRNLRHTQNNKTSIECMQSMPHDTLLQP